MSSAPIYLEHTENIVCPHCGHEKTETTDFTSDEGTVECELYKQEFKCVRHVEITFSTSKIVGENAYP